MYTYFVTFRIADDLASKSTYEARYQSLMKNLAEVSKGGYWNGTTSFVIVESSLSTPDMAKALFNGLSSKDELVVFDPSDMSLAYSGSVSEPDVLSSFFKNARRVG